MNGCRLTERAKEDPSFDPSSMCPPPGFDDTCKRICPTCEQNQKCPHLIEEPSAAVQSEAAPLKNDDIELCKVTQLAYGLRGCYDCEANCSVKDNNLNILANLEATLQPEKEPAHCDHRMTAPFEGMEEGHCEAAGIRCPTPDLVVKHGKICAWAERPLG